MPVQLFIFKYERRSSKHARAEKNLYGSSSENIWQKGVFLEMRNEMMSTAENPELTVLKSLVFQGSTRMRSFYALLTG